MTTTTRKRSIPRVDTAKIDGGGRDLHASARLAERNSRLAERLVYATRRVTDTERCNQELRVDYRVVAIMLLAVTCCVWRDDVVRRIFVQVWSFWPFA